jgi:hypothetical protein
VHFFKHYYWCTGKFGCRLNLDGIQGTVHHGNCIWIGKTGDYPYIFIRLQTATRVVGPLYKKVYKLLLSNLRMELIPSSAGGHGWDLLSISSNSDTQQDGLGHHIRECHITSVNQRMHSFLNVVKVCQTTLINHAGKILQEMDFFCKVPNQVARDLGEEDGPVCYDIHGENIHEIYGWWWW